MLDVVRGHRNDRETDGERVARKNRREGLAHDRSDPPPIERLRCVLAGRTAAEVGVHEQNGRSLVLRLIKRMRSRLAFGVESLVDERIFAHAVERDFLQVSGGHDAIGIHVVAPNRKTSAYDLREPSVAGHYRKSRTSARWPLMAVAAT